jgi:multidrug resistance efflux pump
MPPLAVIPWKRRPDLTVRPVEDGGHYVVKDPRTGQFFTLGEQEHFLLEQLTGRASPAEVRGAFEGRFHQPLSEEELEEFLELAYAQGFLQRAGDEAPSPGNGDARHQTEAPAPAPPAPAAEPAPPRPRQSLLYYRRSLFDPDRFFTWLAPKIAFVWTPGFVALSLIGILAAAAVAADSWEGLASSFQHALRWEMVAVVWVVLLAATFCHEFAHGLTCKHYGGEVHEVGALLLFFFPCFYCNVSDAWLFRRGRHRLYVTLAGGYFDLCAWAVAVFVWRLSLPDSLMNYLAWVVLSVLGARVFFNFNPLLKLDGYYLLSDLVGVPNLQPRSIAYLMARVRWLLWGGPRPAPEPRGTLLLTYGLASWLFGLAFLALMVASLVRLLGHEAGLLGAAAALFLGVVVLRGMLTGVAGAEFGDMVRTRRGRAALWAASAAGLAAVLLAVDMEDRAGGTFKILPAVRADLRAPVSGFLREVRFEEGDRVSAGALAFRLEVPDLAAKLAEQRSELREAKARVALLEVGPRPEEVEAQRRRVERAAMTRDLARRGLERARRSFDSEVARLDREVAAQYAERDSAEDVYERSRRLLSTGVLGVEQYRLDAVKVRVSQARVEQAAASRRARLALGPWEAEVELARRERELDDARSALRLLEAGSRPEEVEAERARLARAQEAVRYLEGQERKQVVRAPVGGVLTTRRLAEKVGQFFREGEAVAAVEDLSALEAEVTLSDQDVTRVQPGQRADLKARAHPFRSFPAEVTGVAPRAEGKEQQSAVNVYCKLTAPPAELRPGMVGYARVSCGRRPIARVLADRVLRFLRTEFWW